MVLMNITIKEMKKVNFSSHILKHPSTGEYCNIYGVQVLSKNVTLTFFRKTRFILLSRSSRYWNVEWPVVVQYSCTSIWDLKYTFYSNVSITLYRLQLYCFRCLIITNTHKNEVVKSFFHYFGVLLLFTKWF